MESEREKIKEHHKGQYMTLMAFMLKFQRQYVDYLTRQCQEQKKNALPRQIEELEIEYQTNILRCDFDLITTAIEVPTVYRVVSSIREHFELKDKVRSLPSFRSSLWLFAKSATWILKRDMGVSF